MENILDLLNSPESKSLINGVEEKLGISKGDAASVFASAIPMIMGAMRNNSKSPDLAGGLLNAVLGKHANGGLLDNLGDLFKGGNLENVLNDGQKILGHLFNGQEDNAVEAISKSNGIDFSKAASLLKLAAPFILSFIGKKAVAHKVSDPQGFSGLLDGILGDDADSHSIIANKVQTFENNNDTPETIAEFITDNVKKSGILGNLFNDLMN
jgi:hypothetical protein